MKTIVQIILLLCVSLSFSITLSAQEISCQELMKMPLGKYLYDNDDASLAVVINNLEKCGVEKYELELSILSIFISNIAGEKGREATVQDLYDEILIFRKQNDSGDLKARQEQEKQFYEKYSSDIVSKENWINVKPLICDLFGLDEIEIQTFANTLFEEEGDKLSLNYSTFIESYQAYVKTNFHLSKAAKRDSTDFDFGDKNDFPSMNYFARTSQYLYSNKPTLVYFYGYGIPNCVKLNDGSFNNVELYKLVESEFNFVTLTVDGRTELSQEFKEKLQSKYPEKKLLNTGSLNMVLEQQLANEHTQPCFVVLNGMGQVVAKFDYEIAKDAKVFIKALKETLK